MTRILRVPASVINHLGRGGAIVCDVSLVLLTGLTFYEVVARYVFNRPTPYGVEMGEYFMVLISFLVGAHVLKLDRHVRMEVVYQRLPLRARPIFDIMIAFFALSFCAVVFWTGYTLTLFAYHGGYRSSTVLMVPLTPVYALIPLSALLLGLQYVVRIGEHVRDVLRGGA
ncbi:TRAP transporter small permease subunit [Chloroflexota bacterium]